jgi:uncharacterized iron-regulated membrane protein
MGGIMAWKRIVGKLHLFLGLLTGSVVFIVSLTGCLYVFEPQIDGWARRSIYSVPLPEEVRLVGPPPAMAGTGTLPQPGGIHPPSTLFAKAREALGPGANTTWMEWRARDKAVAFWHFKEEKGGFFFWNELREYKQAYVNPYTAEVQGVVDRRFDFFNVLVQIHCSLGLAHPAGKFLVDASVLLFLAMLASGFILWWPRNRAHLKARLRVSWSGGGKRRNYDLHSVGGFYVLPLVLVIACTGLVWSYDWWAKGLYFLVSGKATDPWDDAPKVKSTLPADSVRTPGARTALDSAMDRAFAEALRRTEPGGWVSLGLPEDDSGVVGIGWKEPVRSPWNAFGGASFDRHSGKLLAEDLFKDQDNRKKLSNSLYDIHVGLLYGLPTQILAFLASGLCASLPVTGFLIWRGRRRGSGRKA